MKDLLEQYPFVESANFTHAARQEARVLVIHTMESSEKPGTARAVAEWFAGLRGEAPRASAHFCVDPGDVIQCVRLSHVAWHAPGANRAGIGIEHAGRAAQIGADWDDEPSRAILARSAGLAAELMREAGISPTRLTSAELRAGGSGLCGHIDVTRAFPDKGSGHTDPGPNFPWDRYLELVSKAIAELA